MLKKYLPQLSLALGICLLIIGCGISDLTLQNVFGESGFVCFVVGACVYLKK